MVMQLQKGSLRQHLNDNFNSLSWKDKLYMLQCIAYGLKDIHNSGLIHHDFHCGNLLSDFVDNENVYTTDLGLCQPAICTGSPPYHDMAHEELLAMKICQGLRPKSNYKIPQLIFDKINQCWDADPSKRPKADELLELFSDLYRNFKYNEKDSVIYKQTKEADEINKKLTSSATSLPSSSIGALSYITHPQAVYTSRLLDFKNLPEPKNANNNDDLLRTGNYNSP